MFPIKDTIHARRFSIVTWGIILINVLAFLYETSLSPAGLESLISSYGLVPVNLSLGNPASWPPLISHMFLHGSWLHLLSNMWTLVIFGDNVEDRLGSGRFLLFYLIGGVAAGLLQVFLGAGPNIPSVGASGAIAAVLGAYFLFFPGAKVLTFVPLILIWFIQVPAWIYLGFWFVSQLFSGLSAMVLQSGASAGGIAWWAHIGGFVFGLAMAVVFAGRSRFD
ncbi:MAG: rhomboid family intramembrane serine protease [Bellilinea sp.]